MYIVYAVNWAARADNQGAAPHLIGPSNGDNSVVMIRHDVIETPPNVES